MLARELAHTVGGLRLGLGVLAEREAPTLALPVDGAAGCREDEGGARQPGGLEHVDGADDVHPGVERGLGDGPADVRLRREVKDRIRPETRDQVSDGISIRQCSPTAMHTASLCRRTGRPGTARTSAPAAGTRATPGC